MRLYRQFHAIILKLAIKYPFGPSMVQNFVSDVRRVAEIGEACRDGPAKIMEPPVGYAGLLIQKSLGFGKS